MHEYVQKSTSTTLPRRLAAVSGGELSHCTAPSSDGSVPSTAARQPHASYPPRASSRRRRSPRRWPGCDRLPWPSSRRRSCCRRRCRSRPSPPVRPVRHSNARRAGRRASSRPPVVTVDSCASAPVSRPSAIAPTPASSATPIPRLIHSPAPSERFIAANTLPPITSATPSDVAAPAAYATSSSVVPTLAPQRGPGQHEAEDQARRPQAGRDAEQQRRRGPAGRPSRCAKPVSRLPAATSGRVRCSARRGISKVRPKIASSTIATQRPACATQPPPTAASVATTAT